VAFPIQGRNPPGRADFKDVGFARIAAGYQAAGGKPGVLIVRVVRPRFPLAAFAHHYAEYQTERGLTINL
jgi:hypothetical protein